MSVHHRALASGNYTIDVSAVDFATNEGLPSTADFRAGRRDTPQNLRQLPPLFINEPTFQWNPPEQLPQPDDPTGEGGILRYEVAITGDENSIPPFEISFKSYKDLEFFIVECFDGDENPKQCETAIDSDDQIRLTVLGPVPNGTHELGVRVVDKDGQAFPIQTLIPDFVVKPVVDMRLITDREFVGSGDTFTVDIVVEPNGQPLSVVDAVLEVPPNMEVVDIKKGEGLTVELNNAIDEAAGIAAYTAATFGEPVRNKFTLAVITFKAKKPRLLRLRDETAIKFLDPAVFPDLTIAAYKGVSVLDDLRETKVTILERTVDLVLGLETDPDQGPIFDSFDEFAFERRQEIVVVVRVEPNGQFLSSVDALLDFDPDAYEVQEVIPAPGILLDLEHVVINDRARTIDVSAFTTGPALNTGDPPREPLDLARITLRHKRATRGLSVGFSERFPRRSEAFFREVSVLRDLKGFPAELALELRLKTFDGPSFDADVVIQARLNGNRASAVDAFLKSSGDLIMRDIARAPGSQLGTVLKRAVDPATGTAEYGATIRLVPPFGVPPLGEFDLAVLDITAGRIAIGDEPSTDEIFFQTEFPRRTNVALNGTPIPVERLKGVRMEARPPGQLPNLRRLTSSFDPTPTFQWDPPVRRPAAGIRTFELSIIGSGDIPNQNPVEGDVRNICTLECFGVGGVPVDCFVLEVFDVDGVSWVNFTTAEELEDGRYNISVKAIDNLGQPGEETRLPKEDRPFTIDTRPPTIPITIGDLRSDPLDPERVAFTNDEEPLLEWEASVDGLTAAEDISYDSEIDFTRSFGDPLKNTTNEVSWKVLKEEYPVLTNTLYWWRVRAVDNAGVVRAEPGVEPTGRAVFGQDTAQALAGRGNASDFSPPQRFVIDTIDPSPPGDLKSVPIGGNTINDNAPTFQWVRSTDEGFPATGSGVERYLVEIDDISGTLVVSGDVPDDGPDCDPITGLCTFTVPDEGRLDVDGRYSVTVTAFDRSGTSERPGTPERPANSANSSIDILVDTEPPTAPGVPRLVPLSALVTPDGTSIEIRWTKATDTGSGVDFYNVVVNPGNITGTADDPTDCGVLSCTFRTPPLIDGAYTFLVSAIDEATNEGPATPSDPETPTFVGDPAKPQNLRQTAESRFKVEPVFRWTGPRTGDIRTYEIAITGQVEFTDFQDPLFEVTCNDAPCGPIAPSDTIQLKVIGVDLPEGTHRFRVRVLTPTGERGDPANIPFTVDTKPPGPPTNLTVEDTTTLPDGREVKADSGTPAFTWTASNR